MRIFLAILLAGWLPLFGPQSAGPPTPLLDTLSATARVAYSTRKLRAVYAGSAIQVARTSDATTQNIGFDANNDLDTTALATFCAATTCGVSIWYDQMGLANCAQGAAVAQARIYGGGAVDALNSHGAPYFGIIAANTNCLVTQSNIAQPNTIALASKHNSQVLNGHWVDGNTLSPRSVIGVNGSPATSYILFSGSSVTGGALDLSTHALIGIFNGASSSLKIDGGTPISGNAGTQGINDFVIGSAKGSGAAIGMNGLIGEFIVFNSSISAGDQTLIRTSWQSYWGTL